MKYIFLVFGFCFLQAQTHKFLYKYKFKTDSLTEHYDEAVMVLEVTPD
ncbi:hypothetical protein KRE40_14675 [Elizabethkingia meningoseptica]|nr:hypothetical protein [Elizabethkingia meningoseptica]MCL1676693.1 hypothetical protein [Elizabethkingia meningoseptica]MCL1686702.1 hypothetical protein [Elizabethkingia meningoseptica]MDE5438351.1 hypothetical protein [Elizabethkingia meningoseptica]MDE5451129.1 hypothetical protein [Elizabethkingia meningoseptica]MDE5472897.1 hypothetical protein [Elizabethkingia meningoseptica]